MKRLTQIALFLTFAVLPALGGCGRNIVRAASPSVATPPSSSKPVATASAPAPAAEPIPAPEISQPAPPELAPSAAAEPAPPRPRPATPPVAPGPPQPSAPVAPPLISPVLTAADQQRLTQLATDQIRVAERNLQVADGKRQAAADKRLKPLQEDLFQKVQGFLSQAHEAIRDNDWVRAQNLAEKAQVLSSELVKSL